MLAVLAARYPFFAIAHKLMNNELGESMNLKKTDKIRVENDWILVNGRPFVIEHPSEPVVEVENNQLVTCFRGCLYNYWNVEDISGRWVYGNIDE